MSEPQPDLADGRPLGAPGSTPPSVPGGGPRRGRAWILLVLLAGGLVSAAGAYLAWRAGAQRDEAEFERQIALYLRGYETRRNGIEDILRALRAVFNQNPRLSRAQFHEILQDLWIRVEAVQALVWAPRVRWADRGRVEESVRQEGFPTFQFTEGDMIHFPEERPVQAWQRDEYAPVMYLEPFAENAYVMGYDLASVPEMKAALQAARESGAIRLSSLVRVRYQDQVVWGFVAVIPVYAPALLPAAGAAREEQLLGWVLGVMVLPKLMERLEARIPRLDLDVMWVDATVPERPAVMHTRVQGNRSGRSPNLTVSEFRDRPVREVTTALSDRRWQLVFRRSDRWIYGPRRWPPLSLLASGLLLTGLVAQRMNAASRRTREVEWLVALRTRELAETNVRLEAEVKERTFIQGQMARDRQLLRALIDRLPDGAFVTDNQVRYLRLNDAHVRLLGLEDEAGAVGRRVAEVGPTALARLLAAGCEEALASSAPRLHQEHTVAEGVGGRRIFLVSWLPMRVREGAVEGLVVLVGDLTEARRVEASKQEFERQLQGMQKLESLGVLAGGIAHDFNNLLTTVLGNVGLARAELPAGSPVREFLDQIEQTAIRAADLCKQLLAYSGKGRFVVRRLDLSQLVRDTLNLLRLSVSKKARLQLELAQGLPAIEGDATQIRQILMNLVINASDALGDRVGVIQIHTACRHFARAELDATLLGGRLPEGDYVTLAVVDDGCGMDADTCARVFEPFFTTKFTGRGLGLAAVLGIVRGHHGTIELHSQPGQGTTFRLLLPAVAGAAEAEPPGLMTPPFERGSGTILVVDDEEAVRAVAGRVLQQAGFQVDGAADGQEALDRFTADPDRYCAVLLDLTMPRKDGAETFRVMRQLRPGLRVLLMSGYSSQQAGERFAGEEVDGFLQKPFGAQELRAAVGRLLGPTPSAGG